MCCVTCAQAVLTEPRWLRLHARLAVLPRLSKGVRKILPRSATVLAMHYLRAKGNGVYCREEHFEAWQDVLAQMSPLPLIAAHFQHEHPSPSGMLYNTAAEEALRKALRWSSLPHCAAWDSWVAACAEHTQSSLQVHDFHVHFSGVLQPDTAWQRCLADPSSLCKSLARKITEEKLPIPYAREDIGDALAMLRRLRLARWLQETLALLVADEALLSVDLRAERRRRQHISWNTWGLLCALGTNCDSWFDTYFGRCQKHIELGTPFFRGGEGSAHPLAQCEHWSPFWPGAKDAAEECLAYEGVLWLRALLSSSPLVACMLHCYGLLSSQFVRLAVQQPDTPGFMAFLAAEHSGLTRTHHLYQQQFMQLHSMNGQASGGLDCRFTPKSSAQRNEVEYQKYKRALLGEEPVMKQFSRLQPATPAPFRHVWLRPHFIKSQDKSASPASTSSTGNPIACRHAKLRGEVEHLAQKLTDAQRFAQKKLPVYGKDAAGNEASCPPEVFAPAFRLLARGDGASVVLSHTTYHVGEIFSDVTSGVRAVDEALRFLDLRRDDRIGHGTALGMDPAWWRQRKSRVTLRKGNLLDNLVWVWGIGEELNALSCASSGRAAMHALFGPAHAEKVFLPQGGRDWLREKIFSLYAEIYVPSCGAIPDKNSLPDVLYRAWTMRGLDARRLEKCSRSDMTQWEQTEIANVDRARTDTIAFGLFRAYHTDARVRQCYDMPVEEDMGYIADDVIRMLQDYVVLKIINAGIVVEVMPTSNRRILGYATYAEHHAVPWLCGNQYTQRPSPAIVLATDNPGLFSTNIRNEYTHILLALKALASTTDSACLDAVIAMHKKGNSLLNIVP